MILTWYFHIYYVFVIRSISLFVMIQTFSIEEFLNSLVKVVYKQQQDMLLLLLLICK